MALKALVSKEEYDALDGTIRAEYKAQGDRFIIDVVAVDGRNLEDVSALKSSLSSERTMRERQESILKSWGVKEVKDEAGKITGWDYGDLKPDVVKKAMTKLAELEKIDPKTEAGKIAEQQIEAAKRALTTTHETAIGEKDTKILVLDKALDEALVDSAITAALADGEVKGNSTLLTPLMRKHVVRKEAEGKFTVVVVDVAGNPKVNGKADPMSVKEFALELREDKQYAGAFEGSGHSGGGGSNERDRQGQHKALGDKALPVDRISAGLRDPKTVAGAAMDPLAGASE
jgi:hypothetical protein